MSDIYDYEYDDRTWAEKYRDDNTWQRDTGLVEYVPPKKRQRRNL